MKYKISKLMLSISFVLLWKITVGQVHLDQNLIKTSLTNELITYLELPTRYELLNIGYNSHHWETGGVIVVELFQSFFGSGYERYIIENGFGQGANHGSPKIKLTESRGMNHHSKLVVGVPIDLGSDYLGTQNKVLPIYLDIRNYSRYIARITYLQDRVETINWFNQIKINLNPSPQSIPDFQALQVADADLQSSGNLLISGFGNHSISNGNLGIGTTSPSEKLSVNGNIRAKEIKVEMANWPDYVFKPGYKIATLAELEKYIKANQHLPNFPSALEVENSGVELGDIIKKLLKNQEELTLHLIDQNKEIQRLKEQLNVQSQPVKKRKIKR